MSGTPEASANAGPVNRLPLKYRWSHRLKIHRVMVKLYNAVATRCPFAIKYGIGKRLRASQFPYKLIQPGSTVVQIGAPRDTLVAGRSRGMYFSLFNGPQGKTVIIEPASASEEAFNKVKRKRGLNDLIFVKSGAWNEEKLLKLYVDPNHPATNFTEGTVEYDEERLAQFDMIEIPVKTVDQIMEECGIEKIDMISMTTNGAEIEILQGMSKTLAQGIPYICIALHTHRGDFEAMMRTYGYEPHAYDDRGITYRQV